MKRFLFLFFVIVTQLGFAQDEFIITGQITKFDGQPAKNIPVVILRFNDALNPPLFPLSRSTTNEKGEYRFVIVPEDDWQYTIGMLLDEQRLNTEYFRYEGQKNKRVDFRFPPTADDKRQITLFGKVTAEATAFDQNKPDFYILRYKIRGRWEFERRAY